ncbi:MAG: DUF692 domain-containing protein [Chromatiales bacterium]
MMPSTAKRGSSSAIPASAGIGLRADHYREVLETRPAVGWFEVHSENYFGAGGLPLHYLEQVRAEYPISLHGVGLSLGSADPLNPEHLRRLKNLVDRFAPGLVSEHLCWSSIGGRYLNDLVPLPYTEEALGHMVARVSEVQETLNRHILIENISSYLEFSASSIPEWEFLREVAQRSGCGILLDVNNIYVSARNHGFDPRQYLRSIPGGLVEEIHLAGFTVNRFEGGEILIDTHNHPVAEEVWGLYALAIERFGPKPALIEWDADLPPLGVLLAEAGKADRIQEMHYALAA